jgi:hypothetical protein
MSQRAAPCPPPHEAFSFLVARQGTPQAHRVSQAHQEHRLRHGIFGTAKRIGRGTAERTLLASLMHTLPPSTPRARSSRLDNPIINYLLSCSCSTSTLCFRAKAGTPISDLFAREVRCVRAALGCADQSGHAGARGRTERIGRQGGAWLAHRLEEVTFRRERGRKTGFGRSTTMGRKKVPPRIGTYPYRPS